MENMSLEQLLIEGAKKLFINIKDEQIAKFLKYKDLLLEWNEKINLTAIKDEREVIIKHFIDSLTVLQFIKNKSLKLIDVGTGGGFPGIPIKIMQDKINVTLFDSLEKRVKFLNQTINEINLTEIDAVHGRAEDFGVRPDFREKFDVCVARAVANLPVLLEYCLPFVKQGGTFIAMKANLDGEVESSKKALDLLGGKLVEVKEMILPFTDNKRSFVIVKKFRQTPTKFPRKAGKPSKEPLI